MKIPELNILSYGTWRNSKRQKKTPSRFVLTYEIEYHHQSYGETTINGNVYPIEKDTITFNRPGDIRNSRFNLNSVVETDFFYFVLSNDQKSNTFDYMIRNIPNHIVANEHMLTMWQELMSDYAKRKDPLYEMQSYFRLLTFLTYLSQTGKNSADKPEPPSSHQRALFEAIRYMYEHLTENLSVNDMAAHIGYSQSHFNHLFKTYTQHTPHSYYISLKISEAKYMLLNTEKSLSQISEALAFGKVSQFSSAFKKECHVTPGQFRKSHDAVFYND